MRVTELRNHAVGVEKLPVAATNGQEVWRLVFTDQASGDATWLVFDAKVRDQIVKHLTGVVIPTGPLMAVPKGRKH